jgi:methylated-DNA-protein-cysteine methyltransferase-like protein
MSWDPVYQLIKKIPRGKVTTYGRLARALKIRGGARTVGHAMAATPSGAGIPWHRVVAAGGRLIIREPYGSKQRRLLESEGVPMRHDRVDVASCEWMAIARGAKRRGGSVAAGAPRRARSGKNILASKKKRTPKPRVARPVPRVI